MWFLATPKAEESVIFETAYIMDSNETNPVIQAAQNATGKSMSEILEEIDQSRKYFSIDAGGFPHLVLA